VHIECSHVCQICGQRACEDCMTLINGDYVCSDSDCETDYRSRL
jgi:hypothetical protein